MPTLLPSGLCDVSWCHIRGASAGLSPVAGVCWCCGSQGGERATWSAAPRNSIAHFPLHGTTISRSNVALLQASNSWCTQSMEEQLRGKTWEETRFPQLLLGGFPPPAYFIRIAPPTNHSNLPRAHWKVLGYAWGGAVQV